MTEQTNQKPYRGALIEFQTSAMHQTRQAFVRQVDSNTVTLDDDTVIPRHAILRGVSEHSRDYADHLTRALLTAADAKHAEVTHGPTTWYRRVVSGNGTFSFNGSSFYYGYHRGRTIVYVHGNKARICVFDTNRNEYTHLSTTSSKPKPAGPSDQPRTQNHTWYPRRVAKNGDLAYNSMHYYYDYHAGGRTVSVRPIEDDAGPCLRVYDKTRDTCTDIPDSKARLQSHRKKKQKTTQQKSASPPAQTTTDLSTEQLCKLGEQLQEQIGDLITRVRAGQQAAETIWLLANAADIKHNQTQEDQ